MDVKKRYTEEQIIGFLKDAGDDRLVTDPSPIPRWLQVIAGGGIPDPPQFLNQQLCC